MATRTIVVDGTVIEPGHIFATKTRRRMFDLDREKPVFAREIVPVLGGDWGNVRGQLSTIHQAESKAAVAIRPFAWDIAGENHWPDQWFRDNAHRWRAMWTDVWGLP